MAPEGEGGEGQSQGEGQGTQTPSWTDNLSEETRGFIESKGIKTPDDLVKGWKNAESFVGTPAERLVRFPEDMEAEGALDEIYTRLGRPESAEGYEIPTVTIGSGEGSVDLSPQFKEAAHKAGLTPAQAKELAGWYNGLLTEGYEAQAKAREEQGNADILALEREWGDGYQAHLTACRRATQWLGWSEQQADEIEGVLGTKTFMQTLAKIGRDLGEHVQPSGDRLEGGAIGISVPEARARFEARKNDVEFMERVERGDPAAIQEMERLAELAARDKERPGGPPPALGGPS